MRGVRGGGEGDHAPTRPAAPSPLASCITASSLAALKSSQTSGSVKIPNNSSPSNDPVAVGVGNQRIGAVDVDLVPIGDPIGVGVGVVPGRDPDPTPAHRRSCRHPDRSRSLPPSRRAPTRPGRLRPARLRPARPRRAPGRLPVPAPGRARRLGLGRHHRVRPGFATPVVWVPGAMETLDDPGCPDPGAVIWPVPAVAARPAASRFAPSGTLGAEVVSAGASEAGAPSSAVADSFCAETLPKQSKPLQRECGHGLEQPCRFHARLPFRLAWRAPCQHGTMHRLAGNLARGAASLLSLVMTKRDASRVSLGRTFARPVLGVRRELCSLHEHCRKSRSPCTMTPHPSPLDSFGWRVELRAPEGFRSRRPGIGVEGKGQRWWRWPRNRLAAPSCKSRSWVTAPARKKS